MITLKLKHWRTMGVAATTLGLAACGGEGGAGGEGSHGEAGEAAQGEGGGATPATTAAGGGEAGEAAAGEAGGEHGEAGVVTAYAGLSGSQLTALRIQHLRGFVMAAAKIVEDQGSFSGEPADAAILVQQGLLEVYEPAAGEFGTLNVTSLREAAAGTSFTRAQMMQRLRTAQEELTRAIGEQEFDDAQLAVRMIDISTGLYQHVLVDGVADPIEYQHSMGAALAAQQALQLHQDELRRQNLGAYSRAVGELNRYVALFPSREPPQTPATYQQVLVQGSRVRLALSPYL
ncbi:hypothetical protein [Candidatus Viadribacter manganicus]|uniref:Uncharacterized protein n=1 Tax=Candidatus Viadribacter manganicus TaxID=1759059 RepID=A0A1B1AFM7_9PROT|nr:hypothetical protein [Candidatus Viadribacter manganicus]ANP45354.1 hypothetical protein ATE48_05210 [Candidatus Viadribacter manganicus]